MANLMFGWSAQDLVTLIQTCDRFVEAYRDGPGGARTRLKNFKEQVENCKEILTSIQNELQKQDREFFESKFQQDSLKNTLEECVKIFDKSEFLKPQEEQGTLPKVIATAKYLWGDEKRIAELSGILQGHVNYIQVFLHLLQSKNSHVQIAHLKNHGKHLEMHTRYFQEHDQKLYAIHQDLGHIRQLLDSQFQPRGIPPLSRAQSLISVPAASSGTAVVAPGMYIQGQKSLVDVQDLLEQVNAKIDDPVETYEKEILRSVRDELEAVEERILVSMQRNEAKGVQIALAESVRQHHEGCKHRRRSRQDSGYASSIGSMEIHQNSPSPISRRPTDSSVDSSWSAVSHPNRPLSQVHRNPTDSGDSNWFEVTQTIARPNPSHYTTVEICEAEILFSITAHKPIRRPCTVCAKYKGDWVSEIFPDYTGKLPDGLEIPSEPTIIFRENVPRPIPHVEPRGRRASKLDRHVVQLKGSPTITPFVKTLEYLLKTAKDSEKFQELVFGKKLQWSINIHKIRSGRDKESDGVALKLWMIQGRSNPTRRDYSILYYVNDESQSVKEHIEIFLHEIEELMDKTGKWLRVRFKEGTKSEKTLKWLEFRLGRSLAEENKIDRATLAEHLDPTWKPIRN